MNPWWRARTWNWLIRPLCRSRILIIIKLNSKMHWHSTLMKLRVLWIIRLCHLREMMISCPWFRVIGHWVSLNFQRSMTLFLFLHISTSARLWVMQPKQKNESSVSWPPKVRHQRKRAWRISNRCFRILTRSIYFTHRNNLESLHNTKRIALLANGKSRILPISIGDNVLSNRIENTTRNNWTTRSKPRRSITTCRVN